MSAPVDVLSVMDAMYGQVWRDHGRQGGEVIERLLDSGEQARAAVADLIDALNAAMAFIESHVADPDITEEMARNYAALQTANPRAALVRCGCAK